MLWYAAAGLPPPRVVVEVGNTAAQLTGLLGSDLTALMSKSLLDSPNTCGVAALPLVDARFRRQIGVLTRRDARPPTLAERFIEILREFAGLSSGTRSPDLIRSPDPHAVAAAVGALDRWLGRSAD